MGLPVERLELLKKIGAIVADLNDYDKLMYLLACLTDEQLNHVIKVSNSLMNLSIKG